jgi:hypothetical protein
MTSMQRRGPSQDIQARELKAGDLILSRNWTILATKELDGGLRIQVSATSTEGMIRQTSFSVDEIVEVVR